MIKWLWKSIQMIELEDKMRQAFIGWKKHERLANEYKAVYELNRRNYENVAGK